MKKKVLLIAGISAGVALATTLGVISIVKKVKKAKLDKELSGDIFNVFDTQCMKEGVCERNYHCVNCSYFRDSAEEAVEDEGTDGVEGDFWTSPEEFNEACKLADETEEDLDYFMETEDDYDDPDDYDDLVDDEGIKAEDDDYEGYPDFNDENDGFGEA